MKGTVTLSWRPMIVGEQPEGIEHPLAVETFGSMSAALDVVRASTCLTIFRLETPRAKRPYLYTTIGTKAVRLPAPPSILSEDPSTDWLQAWRSSRSPYGMTRAFTQGVSYLLLAVSLPQFRRILADMVEELARQELTAEGRRAVRDALDLLVASKDAAVYERIPFLRAAIGAIPGEPRRSAVGDDIVWLLMGYQEWIRRPHEFPEAMRICQELAKVLQVPAEWARVVRQHIPEDLVFQGLHMKAAEGLRLQEVRAARATAATERRAAVKLFLREHRL